MDTLREYSGYIWFMFTRVNAQIVSVRILRKWDTAHIPMGVCRRIFNELGINTERDYVSISPESAEALVGLLTTLGIEFRQTTGN